MKCSVWYLSIKKDKIVFEEYPKLKSKQGNKIKKRLKKNGKK